MRNLFPLVLLLACVLPISAVDPTPGVIGITETGRLTQPQSPAQPGVEQVPAPGKKRLQKVVVTSPRVKDVLVTQQYPGRIHARRHIDIRALANGFLEEVPVKEGQAVKQGEVLFRVSPILYQTRLEVERAEATIAEIEYGRVKKLFDQKVVSTQEVELAEAKLARARARVKLAQAELDFTQVKAPFDGFIGRLQQQQGSLISEKDTLTTLSDNSVMWVYFNVSEARYLEYREREGKSRDSSHLRLPDSRIELELANGKTFDHAAGDAITVEGLFRSETGNMLCRADFPNPDRLLRHGQSGTVLIRRVVKNALVIPRRATFETLDRRYVYVVGEDGVAHRREIAIQHELDDVFVIEKGLDVRDRIVLDGVQRVGDGDKVDYVYQKPEAAFGNPKSDREK